MHFEQRLATIVASHGGYRYESGTHSILNPTSIIEPPSILDLTVHRHHTSSTLICHHMFYTLPVA